MAASTSAPALRGSSAVETAAAGGGHRAEEDPAEGLHHARLELVAATAPSETISCTIPKVVRSSCSR